MNHVLDAREVTRLYAGKPAVAGANLRLQAGRIHCLLGPSGCGKSTLLRLIAGLEPLDAGVVSTGERVLSGPGVHLPPERRDVGFVFQDYALFPHLTVLQNVAFGLRRAPDRDARALDQLARVRLADRARAYPQVLSGGEQQRVALARALARQPAVILLDEPFSGLDGRLKAEVRDTTLAALKAAGAAALVVTHDAEEALMMADDLSLMEAGRILQTGAQQAVYAHPVSYAAARLLGEADALPAQVRYGQAATAFGSVPTELTDGPATVIARPEAYRFGEGGVPATVSEARFAGHSVAITLTVGDATAHARAHPAEAPIVERTVQVSLDPRFCTVFSPS